MSHGPWKHRAAQLTFAQVSHELQSRCGIKLTPTRIKQIENEALEKLRKALVALERKRDVA